MERCLSFALILFCIFVTRAASDTNDFPALPIPSRVLQTNGILLFTDAQRAACLCA